VKSRILHLGRWWRVVGALSMNLALGTMYAWSVFVVPLEKEFGWKRANTSTAYTIAALVFAAAFTVAGRLQDKYGPFWVAITGGLAVGIGYLLCAHTHSLSYLYLCFGVIVGFGNGFGYATPIPVVAKWFPDKRGLAVGLAVAGYGAGSAVFGPLSNSYLIPTFGWRMTFQILGIIFLVMTLTGALLLQNPPVGYYAPRKENVVAATTRAAGYQFSATEVLATPTFYLMWIAYAFGTAAGVMVISQLIPFARSKGVLGATLASMTLLVGALGNASGRILSGWISDGLGRLNVLRLMIGITALGMPILYWAGNNVMALYFMIFVVYWCYGTQLSVNASTTADFWGTKNAGINYGMLFTAVGLASTLGPRLGGVLFDKYKNYQAAFYTAAGLAVIAFICELAVKRPSIPQHIAAIHEHSEAQSIGVSSTTVTVEGRPTRPEGRLP
jgi:OFA family oxalate/formate antiporter-like MFS transporter